MNKIDILRELKDKLNKNLKNTIKEVILFGSQASNSAHKYSDYDILIIVNTDLTPQVKEHIISLCYDIDLKYNILTDTHILSVKELDSLKGKQPIFTNAMKNGIHV